MGKLTIEKILGLLRHFYETNDDPEYHQLMEESKKNFQALWMDYLQSKYGGILEDNGDFDCEDTIFVITNIVECYFPGELEEHPELATAMSE